MKHKYILYKALFFYHYSHDKATRPIVTFNFSTLLQLLKVTFFCYAIYTLFKTGSEEMCTIKILEDIFLLIEFIR